MSMDAATGKGRTYRSWVPSEPNLAAAISRWSSLGIQGALLSFLLEPVYLRGIIVGLDPTASSREAQRDALERAIISRLAPEKNLIDSSGKAEAIFSQPNKCAGSDCIRGAQTMSQAGSVEHKIFPQIFVTTRYDCPDTSFKFSKSAADFNKSCLSLEASPSSLHVFSSENVGDDDSCSNILAVTTEVKEVQDIPRKILACGTSINWIRDVFDPDVVADVSEKERKRLKPCGGGTVEVTVADTGMLQGSTKSSFGKFESSSRLSKKCSAHLFSLILRRYLVDPTNLTSTLSLASALHADKIIDNIHFSGDLHRLSSFGPGVLIDNASPNIPRFDIHQDIHQLVENLLRMPYAWWKRADPAYVNNRKNFLSAGPFKLWLCDDPFLNEQFSLEESSAAALTHARNTVKKDSIVDAEKTVSLISILHNRVAPRTDDMSTKKARREQCSEH